MHFQIEVGLRSNQLYGVGIGAERRGNEEFYFNIPRLSADKALIKFVRQAELTLLFPYQEVKKYKARALHGRFTIEYGL
ncbi:MAG: hypothetical protein ACI9XU_001374 [Arenicella sp.]